MSARDRTAGSGGAPEGTEVDPSASEAEPPEDDTGAVAIPIGTPAGPDELRELKRRAEQPDPAPEDADTADEDPHASGR
jgi:hypothetical protein